MVWVWIAYSLEPVHIVNINASHHAISSRLLGSNRWCLHGTGSTGTYVLGRLNSVRVCKLGDDPGLIAFATYLQRRSWVSCLPRVFGIAKGTYIAKGTHTVSWTGLWCERLAPISRNQAAAWSKWITLWKNTRGSPQTDPFDAAVVLNELRIFSKKRTLGLDVLSSNNVMCRPGTNSLVFSDPLS